MTYHIARNGQQLGVFPEHEVRAKLQANEFLVTDLFWAEGMGEWKSLGSTTQFSGGANAAALNPYAPPSTEVTPMGRGQQVVELASLGQRLGAALLDSAVALVCAIPLFVAMAMSEGSDSLPPVAGILMAVGGVALLALMVYNIVLLVTRGQSVGKKLLGIRIADYETNGNPGGVKVLLLRIFVNGIIGAIPFVGGIYSIVDICFIFRADRRCVHDLIAGTHVVQGSLS